MGYVRVGGVHTPPNIDVVVLRSRVRRELWLALAVGARSSTAPSPCATAALLEASQQP